jgi:ribosomal protein S18 acetylase RimI-like enzyme
MPALGAGDSGFESRHSDMKKNNNIKLVSANKKDLTKIAPIFNKVFSINGDEWTNKSALKHLKQNFHKDTSWIAKDGDKIVGFCMALIQTIEEYDELFIDSIGVLPEYEKKDIEEKMLKKAEQHAKKHNMEIISVLVNPDWESFDWYKKHSFKKSGWVELFKDLK